MNGKHEISVSNRDISFKFTLERDETRDGRYSNIQKGSTDKI